ncbi:uncharacterized protein LOC123443509 isoform X1 [Hordeum vulgare subsp. vulgare]|uniref:J domain-containing protein n=1 Tax=Hordeum vulgare subsp. vulgare TaxID=112509 RepID=A0A8I6WR95_HORVV|nr:uncharacterized protein LOC123443509 isoform X1 [Hordeum vulgare subsp. vulgare]
MDPSPDPHAASAPFPTIPAATHRPRVARPRRQAAPFRSDHPGASCSSTRRLGADPASFAAGPGSRPSTAGGSRPSAFVFGADASTPNRAVAEDPASAGSWGSSRAANFVFGSGVSARSEMKRSSSVGSSAAPLCSLSAAADELVHDDSAGKQRDGCAHVSRGNASVLEIDPRASFGASEINLSSHDIFRPSILHGVAKQRDEGRGIFSQRVGCKSRETNSSLAGPAVNATKCTVRNDSLEFPKDRGNSSAGDSVDKVYFTKDGSKLSATGDDVKHDLFVFGEGASAQHSMFAANTEQSNVKKLDSSDKEDVTCSSGQLGLSATEDGRCIKSQLAPGSRNRDAPHSRPCEVHETEKASNTAPFSIGAQDDIVKVSFIKLPDGIQTQVGAASGLAECRSFDERSFTLQDHNSPSGEKGVIKAMSMNRRAVKPKKFSSPRQVSSLRNVLAADSFSVKVTPETNFSMKQSGKVDLRLEDSGICVGNSGPEVADATQTAESSHHGTGITFAANLESCGNSDLIFASSTFDRSKLGSQRQQNRSSEGMTSHTNSVQSLPTSAISLAHTEVSASQPHTVLAPQWTEYSKAEPTVVTCTKTGNFRYQEDCETWRIRGNQAYAAGQLAKAEECYTHGINSVSQNQASQKALMLCYSNRAATRISLGRMRDALSDCRRATEIDSSFLKAQVRAANCLLALGDVKEAQKGFEICLKSNHAASLDHKIIQEASDGLQKAQKVSTFMLQSKEYLVKKEFNEIPSALQMITDALSISIHSDNLMKMKAEALLLLRRYEELIQFCEETLQLAERNSVSLCLDERLENINLDSYGFSVKSWRYYLIAKSYFFIGKLEEAHQFLKKYEQTTPAEYKCGKQSQQSVSLLLKTISELLHLKVAGNEAFQAGKYSEAVEHYTAALLSNAESLHFSAICFGNRAAAYQAMGQVLDAIADCSLAIALDTSYCKVISRRASLYELIRDYCQAENDLRRLISLLEEQLQDNMSMPPEKLDNVRNNLHRANLRLSALERDARKRTSLNMYLILGIEPSCSAADIKKAYRKAALRHHPDKAGNFLVRSENIDDTVWSEIVNAIRRDADYLFKIIGKAYAILSDPIMKSK